MWTTACLPQMQTPAPDSRPCEGGYCHACEGCDTHCDCANTEEPRHAAKETT